MHLASLSPDIIKRLETIKYDYFVEKHEGPWTYSGLLDDDGPDLLALGGFHVLLPIERTRHGHVTPLRIIESADGRSLTLFLKDTSFVDQPTDEYFQAGFVAICERFADDPFYVAVCYHEWYMIDNRAEDNGE